MIGKVVVSYEEEDKRSHAAKDSVLLRTPWISRLYKSANIFIRAITTREMVTYIGTTPYLFWVYVGIRVGSGTERGSGSGGSRAWCLE